MLLQVRLQATFYYNPVVEIMKLKPDENDYLVDMLIEQHELDEGLCDDSSDGGVTINQELVHRRI